MNLSKRLPEVPGEAWAAGESPTAGLRLAACIRHVLDDSFAALLHERRENFHRTS